MRDIIFCGKRVDNGEWVCGVPIWDESNPEPRRMMVANIERYPRGNNWEVIPETVGQYTGLKDKNGRMIFEGDVVRIEDFVNATVKWREDIACWTLNSYIIGNTWGSSMLEVIGNIHDQKKDV